ncbi:hypothetical protein [Methylocystis hirsuta]|uniref:hypothetical protein n=1 Tax=Methylocystis hirsuta TaxID=369798 RepID=UPI0011CE3634|nr:hypothetical protein [Methylocystis hirsuta]
MSAHHFTDPDGRSHIVESSDIPRVTVEHVRRLSELGFVSIIDEHGRFCAIAKCVYQEAIRRGEINPWAVFQ